MTLTQRRWHLRLWLVLGPVVLALLMVAVCIGGPKDTAAPPAAIEVGP